MILSNIFFKLPVGRLLCTWKSPGDTTEINVKNQIDNIVAPIIDRNAINSAKIYPGTNVTIAHNPVVCKFEAH